MAKIKGVFEPFAEYVRNQLNVRKAIMANPRTVAQITAKEDVNKVGKWKTSTDFKLGDRSTPDKIKGAENSIYGPENFYAYTVEKQAIIRMMSGVDLKDNISPELLEIDYDGKGNRIHGEFSTKNARLDEIYLKHAMGLAKQYILEGGTRHYNDQGGNKGMREGFTTGKFDDDTVRGFSYGDRDIRADAADGFGIVPMPGIIDAEIRTKSDNGSIREAKVNFVCYNRRQLEILELLYMRPGYPVCLEWGWNPYISNDFKREDNNYSIKNKFFSSNQNMNTLNNIIREYKVESGGNYDGFIGFIKNFSFKAREDGGYDCTTEIMAHGEILESLKSQKTTVFTGEQLPEEESPEVESIDQFLYYLRSIKANLNREGDAYYYKTRGTIYDDYQDAFTLTDPDGDNSGTDDDVFQFVYQDPWCAARVEGQDFVSSYSDIHDASAMTVNQVTCWYSGIIPSLGESFIVKNLMWGPDGWNDPYAFVYDLESDATNIEGDEDAGYESSQQIIDSNMTTEEKRTMLNEVTEHYRDGLSAVISLYLNIQKTKTYDYNAGDPMLEEMGEGFISMLGGTILKQVVKYDKVMETQTPYADVPYDALVDTGYRKNIYVRWDLICQMINHLSTYIGFTDSLHQPITEMTYMNPNAPTWINSHVDDGKIKPDDDNYPKTYTSNNTRVALEQFYIRYAPPSHQSADPILKYYDHNTVLSDGVLLEQSQMNLSTNNATLFGFDNAGMLHPLIGHSYDERVCLLPHMDIFDNFIGGSNFTTGGNTYTIIQGQTYIDESAFDTFNDTTRNVAAQGIFDEHLSSYEFHVGGTTGGESMGPYEGLSAEEFRCKIGHIYFNLDYLLSTYESMRLKKIAGDERTIVHLNNKFNMFDFLKDIWEGVNDACAHQYKFTLTTEHERPHVVRIIDMRFTGEDEETIYRFEPQGLRAITRQFYFDSKISNDMAAVISIAAQCPNNVQSLESLSFKAFHKNIKSRFTPQEFYDDELTALKEAAKAKLAKDITEYQQMVTSLSYYLYKLNRGNFETHIDDKVALINHSEAKMRAEHIVEARNSILNRYPMEKGGVENDGEDGRPSAGFWKKETTFESSAIIPLQFNIQMDGISGMIPLQLFKVDADKLPFAYRSKEIAFIVKSESHKITSGQDWTVEITGQLVLLHTTPTEGEQTYEKSEFIYNPNLVLDLINNPTEISTEGLLFIQGLESFRPYTYEDPEGSGKWSIGYGTQTWNGQKVTATYPNTGTPGTNGVSGTGTPVTEAEALTYMHTHLEEKVYPKIAALGVELSQHQFDAISSYAYNVGGYRLQAGGGPKFYAAITSGDYDEAARQMDIICSGGVQMKGLMNRRAWEQRLFTDGNYTSTDGDWDVCPGCPPRYSDTTCWY